jgi:hypothetical protein
MGRFDLFTARKGGGGDAGFVWGTLVSFNSTKNTRAHAHARARRVACEWNKKSPKLLRAGEG